MKTIVHVISLILFLIGLALAVFTGISAPGDGIITLILAALGVVLGIIAINNVDPVKLIVSVLALFILPGAFASIDVLNIGKSVINVLSYFAIFMSPVALIASIKFLVITGLGLDTRKEQ